MPSSTEEKLILDNQGLVRHIAGKFVGQLEARRIEYQDIISIANIGLIKAARKYDPGKGIKFATFAHRCVMNEILMSFRRHKWRAGELSLDAPVRSDEPDGAELIDIIEADGPPIDIGLDIEIALAAVQDLRPKEREVIYRVFGLFGHSRQTQYDAALEMGLSQSYVARIKLKALDKLRKVI